jgi:hypothetical protein
MFALLLEKFGDWIARAHERRCAEYLSRAGDLADLERRMRSIERDGPQACCER